MLRQLAAQIHSSSSAVASSQKHQCTAQTRNAPQKRHYLNLSSMVFSCIDNSSQVQNIFTFI